MSFEEDVMYLANGVKAKAIMCAYKQEKQHSTSVYGGNIEAYFEPIPSMYAPYSRMPDPAAYEDMRGHVYRTLAILSWGEAPQEIMQPLLQANPNLEMIRGSESYIERWRGPAAEDFKQFFMDPFPGVAKNQFLLAAVLRGGLEAHQLMWANARRDIVEIGNKTLNALDNMMECKDDNDTFVVALTVVEAVATITAAFLAAPVTVATVSVAAVAATAGAGANWPHSKAPEVDLGAPLAYQVIANMADRIRELNSVIYDAELKIQQAMQGVRALVEQNKSAFVANRPTLAGASAGNIKALMGEVF